VKALGDAIAKIDRLDYPEVLSQGGRPGATVMVYNGKTVKDLKEEGWKAEVRKLFRTAEL
jgi:hypothetical protein